MDELPGEPIWIEEPEDRVRPSRRTRRPPPAKNSRAWLILLVLVPFGALFLIGGLAGLVLIWEAGAREEPITPEERALLLDADRLAEWMDDFEPDPAFETAKKTVYLDGSIDLDYLYDDPADEAPYLDFSVTIEKKKSDAIAGYLAAWPAMSIGLEMVAEENVEVVERNDLFSWGDQCHFAILKVDGKPSGHMMEARRGKVLVSIILWGLFAEDPDILDDLFGTHLQKIASYRPIR